MTETKLKKTSSTTPSSRSLEDIKELVVFMKSQGVTTFSAGDVTVEFDPHSGSGLSADSDEDPEQRRARLLEELKFHNEEKRINEEWSA